MVRLSSPNIHQIVAVLANVMNDEPSRRAILILAFGIPHPLEGHISFSEPTSVFVPLLVDELMRYGLDEDGNHPLRVLLDTVAHASLLGWEKRQQIQGLIESLFSSTISEDETPTEPTRPAELQLHLASMNAVPAKAPPKPDTLPDTQPFVETPTLPAPPQTQRLQAVNINRWLNDLKEAEERESWSAMIHIGEHILSVEPDHTYVQRRTAEAYNQRGMMNGQERDYERAIDDFTHALELNCHDGVYFRNRAICYHAKGNYDRAIEDYSAALRIQPHVSDYYIRRALSYDRKGEYDAALQDKICAIQLDPTNAEYYKECSITYRKRSEARRMIGDFVGAWDDLKQALLEANHAIQMDERLASAYFARSRVYRMLGDKDAEAADLEYATQLGDAMAKIVAGQR